MLIQVGKDKRFFLNFEWVNNFTNFPKKVRNKKINNVRYNHRVTPSLPQSFTEYKKTLGYSVVNSEKLCGKKIIMK